MKTNYRVVGIKMIMLLMAWQISSSAFATDIPISDEPLAIKTEGANPNIMLMLDDSGSMDTNDVFYAPGYDSDYEYKCAAGTPLAPVTGAEVTVHISKRTGYIGTPYYTYDGVMYGWGGSGNSTAAAGQAALNKCFDPDQSYQVKLKAEPSYVDTATTTTTKKEYYCGKGYSLKYSNSSKAYYCQKKKNWYWAYSRDVVVTTTDPVVVPFVGYMKATESTKQYSGNFLNWYFSATKAEYSDASLTGGYSTYSGEFWSQAVATNFVTSDSNTDYRGFKSGVHFKHDRMEVAIDVSKLLVRKLTDVNIALSSFHTRGNGGKSTSQNGYLMHGFVPLKASAPVTTNANKLSLITTIEKLYASGGTPTSESMVRMANYFFTGWGDEKFDYYAGSSRTLDKNKKISDVLTLSNNATNAVAYNSNTKIVTQDLWCQKNAMAVLTDGQPTSDTSFGGSDKGGNLWTYNAMGTTSESDYGNDDQGIMRVPGALYDHDWLRGIRGTQNIESFFIAFGSEDVVTASIFTEAGLAGGGGVDNSFLATDGGAVVDAFKNIVASVRASSASVTAVAVSSVADLQEENYAFQATYETKFWSSEIKALNVNSKGLFVQPDGTGASRYSTDITPEWLASTVLDNMYILNDNNIGGKNVALNYRSNGVKSRAVYTWSGSAGMQFGSSSMTRPTSAAASFTEFNALPASMRNDLTVLAGTDSRERYDLMMFLLGDITNEVGFPSSGTATEKYRARGQYFDSDNDDKIDSTGGGGLLGDIVNSSPVYVQIPSRPWYDVIYSNPTKKYSEFRALQKNRPAMIYVGANDGMMHGFTVEQGVKNSLTYPKGAELFAYMPTMLASSSQYRGFHFLANPNYQHINYVDGTVTPGDVFADFYSAPGSIDAEWRTVLVGGLRGGGKGYYALDVTCPFQDTGFYLAPNGVDMKQNTCADESFDKKNVLWEFDETDDPDLGLGFGDPIIAKVNYDSGFVYAAGAAGTERNANGKGRWAAIVSNGYNSANGRAALYILFLDGGIDGVWTQGVDYLKIYASNSSVDKVSAKNGLSSATAMDINYDGLIDRVYAGDLKGQLWSFDLSAPATKAMYTASTMPWVAKKLFTTGAAGAPEPITTAPMVSRDTGYGRALPKVDPDLMIMFATGKYLAVTDLTDKSLQTVYGVHDRGVFNLNRYGIIPSTSYTNLEPRIFKEELLGLGAEKALNRTILGNPVNSAQFGWYVPLASDSNNDNQISGTEVKGERLAFRPFLAGDLLVFNTIIPVVGSCSGATQGWTMALDWTGGMAFKEPTYDANLSTTIEITDQGYVGMFNEAAGSELGRGGNNIFDTVNNVARSLSFNFGSASLSVQLGWEEKMPFGVKAHTEESE
jgi:type IV pilus assembly protein PilY1